MEPKRVLPGSRKSSSNGSPMGTAEEPVLDGTFFFPRVYFVQSPTPTTIQYHDMKRYKDDQVASEHSVFTEC